MSDGMKRRDFLKVLGASGAGVAAAGCDALPPLGRGGEAEKLIPFVVPSEDIVPGVPTFYASTCRECPAGCGIFVETHSGRATKVEGNPDHPVSHGNLCPRGQASVQGLYHPDRYTGPFVLEPGLTPRNISWGTAEAELAERIRRARPGSVVFLTGDYTGTKERLVNEFVAATGIRRVVYDPLGEQPRGLNFANANFLISFGADFLETWGSPVDYAWQFAQMHSYRNGRRGKFVWVGPHRPLTGLNADQWVAPRPGTEAAIALAMSGAMDVATAAQQTGVEAAVIEQLAREFRAGGGVALGPGVATSGPNASALQAAVDRLNGRATPAPTRAGMRGVLQLVEQMRAGQVEMLLIDVWNPAYTLPGGVKFAEALQRVPFKVSFSTFPDDTSRLCNMVLPDHHFLEAWDDYVPYQGVYEIVQPALRPVFNTKQVGDVLLSVAQQLGGAAAGVATVNTYYEYLRANFPGGAEAWRAAVKNGGVYPGIQREAAPGESGLPSGFAPPAANPEAAPAPADPAVAVPLAAAPTVVAGPAPSFEPVQFEGAADANFHLVVYPSTRFYDGRTANRPWLLELPDPVTKVPWQSWVEIHPQAAREMKIERGDLLEVSTPYGSLQTYAYIYPGVRPDTVAIQMGLGHEAFGRFTEGRGVNPNVLLGAAMERTTGAFAPYGQRVRVRKVRSADRHTPIPNRLPEGLFEVGSRLQHDREIAQAVSLAKLAEADGHNPGFIPGSRESIHALKGNGGFAPVPTNTDPSAYPAPGTHYGEYVETERRWAMTINLDRCIGCSACVVACNAENNVPVVGPDEVAKGRMLHWLRIERYFGVSRDKEEAYRDEATDDVRFLPMLCQHCGNAPCEPVCPVYAAYHTPDGLNAQVYNRCVGTRYCENNCPYKVRVFNWFTYDFPTPLNWQLNPDVAVREKGVMEKCTFCVQRIHEAERDAAVENRPLRDGEVVPACVQTCPTEVFTFGDITDPDSLVAKTAASNRSYRVLDLLNTQPAIVYLKKVTLHEPRNGGHADHGAPATTGTGAGAAH
ncbi:MAG TPA: 4Fe-4S dicluster domain-containing protein [Longimicrobiaceae bacterium]|nr:4Fe-4S dicluster domain-containing protein [Longimicrobiaceae bacterium]